MTDPNSSQYMKNIDKPIFKNATPSVSEKSGLEQNLQSNAASTKIEPLAKPMTTPPPVIPSLNFATNSVTNPTEKSQLSEREKAGLESTFAKKQFDTEMNKFKEEQQLSSSRIGKMKEEQLAKEKEVQAQKELELKKIEDEQKAR